MKRDIKEQLYRRISTILAEDTQTEGFWENLQETGATEQEQKEAANFMRRQGAKYKRLAEKEKNK